MIKKQHALQKWTNLKKWQQMQLTRNSHLKEKNVLQKMRLLSERDLRMKATYSNTYQVYASFLLRKYTIES